MKSLSKLAALVAGITLVAFVVISSSPVMADSPGQLTGGSSVYAVKNLTQKGSYGSTASAACNEELQYSVRLHNADFGGLTNVQVSANLANGSVTAIPAEGTTYGTTGNVTVSVASGGSLVYENGTATLYDENSVVIRTLPDTIASGGINIGSIAGSTTEFVNFKAKVNCPTPTPTPTPTPVIPKPVVIPAGAKALPNTGPGDVAELFVGTSALGAAGHYLVARRRR